MFIVVILLGAVLGGLFTGYVVSFGLRTRNVVLHSPSTDRTRRDRRDRALVGLYESGGHPLPGSADTR